jgi:hypothetical protein
VQVIQRRVAVAVAVAAAAVTMAVAVAAVAVAVRRLRCDGGMHALCAIITYHETKSTAVGNIGKKLIGMFRALPVEKSINIGDFFGASLHFLGELTQHTPHGSTAGHAVASIGAPGKRSRQCVLVGSKVFLQNNSKFRRQHPFLILAVGTWLKLVPIGLLADAAAGLSHSTAVHIIVSGFF